MVPTEEERLPVRISISVRGLSAVDLFHSHSPPLPTIPFDVSFVLLTFTSRWSCFKPERTLFVLSQTILLIEFPYYVRHLSVYVLGSILADRECCAAQLHNNQ